ncbi:nuclear envelope integral membrane protein 2 [Megalops cyprinoides]|uniref:nuclear envelope integral membrane protein 2 n=1 Tax=Megalops cyprinoides TaxID=118141 RepID=UPI001863BE30|nr:nuclear envelope integral membrane protein 2 [Megalops cyprinoides]
MWTTCGKLILLTAGLIIVFCRYTEANHGYSYADCTFLKANEETTHYGSRCFCYSSGTMIKWKDIWSTFQVRVIGDDGVHLEFPMRPRDCYEPENVVMVARCLINHYWPTSAEAEQSLDIPLVAQEVCFRVKTNRASAEYNLYVAGKKLNRVRFGLFACGLILFYFAGPVCRSSLFYYSAGVSLGVISIFVFLLFILKKFIPKRGLFLLLFGVSSSLSYFGLQQLLFNWNEVLSLYWREVLGYLLVSGFLSFAVCYKHGPITDDRTLTLMTWTLQVIAMVMMYHGITYPTASYALLGVLVGVKCLPHFWTLLLTTCRQMGRLLSFTLGLFKRQRRPQVRFLTEEEYREQGEAYTKASLDGLREHCTKASFPAWDTVLRLRSPQRFADFLRGGSHVSQEESHTHDLQYGMGGAYFEDMIFSGSRGGPFTGRGGSQRGGGDDISEDELEYYSPAPPTPSPLPAPTLTPVDNPSLPSGGSTPLPPAFNFPLCPYPALPYTPHPEPEMEDLF